LIDLVERGVVDSYTSSILVEVVVLEPPPEGRRVWQHSILELYFRLSKPKNYYIEQEVKPYLEAVAVEAG
jgi:hypothetical protein